MYATVLEEGMTLTHPLTDERQGWVQVVGGSITLNGEELSAGDGASLVATTVVEIAASSDAELLLFDLARAS